jgi:hypothetical protein
VCEKRAKAYHQASSARESKPGPARPHRAEVKMQILMQQAHAMASKHSKKKKKKASTQAKHDDKDAKQGKL